LAANITTKMVQPQRRFAYSTRLASSCSARLPSKRNLADPAAKSSGQGTQIGDRSVGVGKQQFAEALATLLGACIEGVGEPAVGIARRRLGAPDMPEHRQPAQAMPRLRRRMAVRECGQAFGDDGRLAARRTSRNMDHDRGLAGLRRLAAEPDALATAGRSAGQREIIAFRLRHHAQLAMLAGQPQPWQPIARPALGRGPVAPVAGRSGEFDQVQINRSGG
jgi:hypothetical protein